MSEEDIQAIFKQAKEEQAKSDQDFEAEQLAEKEKVSEKLLDDQINLQALDSLSLNSKTKSKKSLQSLDESSSAENDKKLLVPGSAVRVVSGTFSEFSGTLKKLTKKTKKVIF